MKINKLNYENYVIDYIEGTLSIELKRDFDLFLENNKEVYDEIKDYMSAPILEEPEVVFTDKKSIIRKNYTGRYALLALIPLLLVGAYFLLGKQEAPTQSSQKQKTEKKTETKEIEAKEIEMANTETESRILNKQKEEVEEVVPQSIEKKEAKREIKKDVKTKQPMLKKENLDVEKMIQASPVEMNFASNETKIEEIKIDEKPSHEFIKNPIELGNMKMSFDFDTRTIPTTEMAFAEAKTFDGSQESKLKEQIKNNSSWLEMFTPASFEDIDLKESLAIQTNVEVNSTRKILNAFIPESLVK